MKAKMQFLQNQNIIQNNDDYTKCTNTGMLSKKIRKELKIAVEYCGKLSTLKNAKNQKKSSYTPSYPRYPQKQTENQRVKPMKIRTDVLLHCDKVAEILKKPKKNIDISNVKILICNA